MIREKVSESGRGELIIYEIEIVACFDYFLALWSVVQGKAFQKISYIDRHVLTRTIRLYASYY